MTVSPPPAGHESCSSLVCLQVRCGSNAAQVKGPKPPPGSLRSSAITSLVRDSQTASFNAARLLKSQGPGFNSKLKMKISVLNIERREITENMEDEEINQQHTTAESTMRLAFCCWNMVNNLRRAASAKEAPRVLEGRVSNGPKHEKILETVSWIMIGWQRLHYTLFLDKLTFQTNTSWKLKTNTKHIPATFSVRWR